MNLLFSLIRFGLIITYFSLILRLIIQENAQSVASWIIPTVSFSSPTVALSSPPPPMWISCSRLSGTTGRLTLQSTCVFPPPPSLWICTFHADTCQHEQPLGNCLNQPGLGLASTPGTGLALPICYPRPLQKRSEPHHSPHPCSKHNKAK